MNLHHSMLRLCCPIRDSNFIVFKPERYWNYRLVIRCLHSSSMCVKDSPALQTSQRRHGMHNKIDAGIDRQIMSIYIAHRRRKTSNALDTLVLSKTKMFSMNVWKTRHYTSDHRGQPTANSRSLVQRQRRTDDQVSRVGNVAQEVDDYQSVVAVYWRCPRLA